MNSIKVAVWSILIILCVYVGHIFYAEHQANEALKDFQLEQDINDRQTEIDTLENYIDYCEDSEICE